MSTSVKVSILLALQAVASPTVFGSLSVQLTESDPTTAEPATVTVAFNDIQVDPASGQANVEVTFDNVAAGDFTVTATSLDDQGVQIAGFTLSQTGTVPADPDPVLAPVSIVLTNVPG